MLGGWGDVFIALSGVCGLFEPRFSWEAARWCVKAIILLLYGYTGLRTYVVKDDDPDQGSIKILGISYLAAAGMLLTSGWFMGLEPSHWARQVLRSIPLLLGPMAFLKAIDKTFILMCAAVTLVPAGASFVYQSW
jgi:hypothetical protein